MTNVGQARSSPAARRRPRTGLSSTRHRASARRGRRAGCHPVCSHCQSPRTRRQARPTPPTPRAATRAARQLARQLAARLARCRRAAAARLAAAKAGAGAGARVAEQRWARGSVRYLRQAGWRPTLPPRRHSRRGGRGGLGRPDGRCQPGRRHPGRRDCRLGRRDCRLGRRDCRPGRRRRRGETGAPRTWARRRMPRSSWPHLPRRRHGRRRVPAGRRRRERGRCPWRG